MKSEMMRFPAGPYTYSRDKDGCDDVWNVYASGCDRPITSIPFWGDEPDWAMRTEATAKLFAAAPDLLEALRMADASLTLLARNGYTEFPAGQEIRAAIELAGGCVKRESDTRDEVAKRPNEPRTLNQALNHVLAHFLPAEQADFEQLDDAIARERHIFPDLAVLNEWLHAMTGASFL
ncbi:MAG TPA: hypothetical protein VN541_16695 [Tepidisphaeraceae bacterium]|nr:hypothetical protein [Tepidisphaeraceae bacterium]